MPPPAPASDAGTRSGSIPMPSSLTRQLHVAADRSGGDPTCPEPARRSTPWRTAFSTSGCTDIAGTTASRVSAGTSIGDVQAVAEAGLLEPQVALDVIELLAERHVRAAVSEQIPRELGEVDQQLARLLRPRVDVARHGGERVVDEVRRDLGPERPQLGLREALLLLGQHRQLDLRRDEARGLLHDPELAVAGRPVAR